MKIFRSILESSGSIGLSDWQFFVLFIIAILQFLAGLQWLIFLTNVGTE